MIVHDLADLWPDLIDRAVLTVALQASATTALVLGALTLAVHLRGPARTTRATEYEEAA